MKWTCTVDGPVYATGGRSLAMRVMHLCTVCCLMPKDEFILYLARNCRQDTTFNIRQDFVLQITRQTFWSKCRPATPRWAPHSFYIELSLRSFPLIDHPRSLSHVLDCRRTQHRCQRVQDSGRCLRCTFWHASQAPPTRQVSPVSCSC